mgnify:CR=1 FL=1
MRTRALLLLSLASGLALTACSTDGKSDGTDATDGTTEPAPLPTEEEVAQLPRMDDRRLVTRLSLDLRGVRPTPAELATIDADPTALDSLIDSFVDDPRFEDRVRQIYAEVYLTRADLFALQAVDYGLEGEPAFARAVGEEPIRLVARVASEDRPWTDIVTADWTMATDQTAAAWDMADHSGDGWSTARYTDGRPAAGVLSTNGMWWRYRSTDSNANRKRANQASRILLCNDYLTRPIDFDRDVDLLDEDAVEDAINNNPGCVNCHVSLDPLSAYFFGFWNYNEDSWLEAAKYHPEREALWAAYLETPPSYYGEPGSSLGDLGRQIAADPRFAECAVEQVYTAMLRRDADLGDTDALTLHREAFIQGDLRFKALVKSVVSDPRYRAGDSDDPLVEAAGAMPLKMVSTDQLASQVEDLTGFAWTYADYEMLANDLVGVRTLAGGADGVTVVRSARSPNATLVLVQERLAELSSIHAVVQAGEAGDTRLFTEVDFTETPATDRDAIVAQIQVLHASIFGRAVAADGPEVEANIELFEALLAIDDSIPAAWAGVLMALLRDPDFLLY